MWLAERWGGRTAQDREQRLSAAHDLLAHERTGVDVLMRALADNTRAIATLESTQQRLIAALEREPPAPACRGVPAPVDLREPTAHPTTAHPHAA